MRKSILFLLFLAVIFSLMVGCGQSQQEKFYEKLNKGLDNTLGAEAQKRTCQANLRTIDGAINAYLADTQKNPDSVEALVQAAYLKQVPTCPSGNLPYELRGNPPEAYCPNDPSHTL